MAAYTPHAQMEDQLPYDRACALYERRSQLEASHREYLEEHRDWQEFLHDFMQAVLIHQPEDVLAFTKEYFTKMKT